MIDTVKDAVVARVFTQFELEQLRFRNGVEKLPRIFPDQNTELEYTFTRVDNLNGMLKVQFPNKSGPRYFKIRISEMV